MSAPIDHFFRTLAGTHDGHAIGVILTGTGSDGTLGLKEVKGRGGLAIVQDPKEAEYDGMPQSAIATGLVDFILPLARMPEVILRFARTRPRDLTHRLGYDQLQVDATAVLDRLVPVHREVRDDEGRWYLTRVLPYRSAQDRIEGVVITFIDITERKKAEEALRESEKRYRLLVESAKEYAIFMLDVDGSITTWNTGAERLFGYDEEEAIGLDGSIIFTEEDRKADMPAAETDIARRKGTASGERWHVRKDGSRFWASGAMELLQNPNGSSRGFLKVLRDNTERKEAEEALRRAKETLEQRVEDRTREVRSLASKLTMAEQEERRRISQILHDDLQKVLYAVNMKISQVRDSLRSADAEALDESLEKAEMWMERTI